MNDSFDLTQTFGPLRAEVETPFLGEVFLQPREFDLMAGSDSILVMGETGSGKTALEMQLRAYTSLKKVGCLLVATWRPQLPIDAMSDEQTAETFMSQAMDALSFAFLQAVVRTPKLLSSGSSWAQTFMCWFVQRFLQGDREYHLSRLADQAVPSGLEAATRLLSETPRVLFPHSTHAVVVPHLTEAIKALNFSGIWIFVDGLDTPFRLSPDGSERFLTDFLSMLDYFEDSAFVFKIIVSRELGLRLRKARGVVTRRFKIYTLKWQLDELIHLAERRAAFALKREKVLLGDLCKDGAWLEWLGHFAGDSPRGWLELTRPILAAYMRKKKSLDKTEWLDIYRQSPPRLRLDLETDRVFIGFGEVVVSAIGYKILRYLYENVDRLCTKSELYYCAYKGLAKEPHTREEGLEDIPSWEGMIDTALWRLRQAVEWDPRQDQLPLYIISKRGRGQIYLENTV